MTLPRRYWHEMTTEEIVEFPDFDNLERFHEVWKAELDRLFESQGG